MNPPKSLTPSLPAEDARLAPLPRNLLDAMRAAGVDPDALARRVGIEPRYLEGGLSAPEFDRFMVAGWQALGDPAFGLRAGRVVRPERFSVVGIAAMSSPDLGTALARKARYNRLIWGDVYEIEQRGDRATLRVAPAGPPRPYSQARIDMELASVLAFARLVTGHPVAAQRLMLRQPRPASADYLNLYREVFGCPIDFDSDDDALVFDTRDLKRALVSENSVIGGLLVQAAEERLGRLGQLGELGQLGQLGNPDGDSLRARATQALRRLLRGSEPTLAAVATQLHMSERTLQRRLAEMKLSFTDLLDTVRHETALGYLREQRVTVEEVGFLLGFATPSSFFRAFKRWTGQTPQGWRRTEAGV